MKTINQTRRRIGKRSIFAFLFLPFAFSFAFAQTETPPAPAAPKAAVVPAVVEKKLPNGLTVAVVERKSSPLVTMQLLVKSGAASESVDKAGLANITADMLTKGTRTRSATQIAEDVEFLGGAINSGAGWNNSFVSVSVTSDKVEQALAILADVVLNPKFDQKELDLLKSQTLDALTYNLKQPSFLANYVASKYTFGEHPAGGTPASIQSITAGDVSAFHDENYRASESVLIFTGDISLEKAAATAEKMFGGMKTSKRSIDRPAVGPAGLTRV
jgi:Predicted Zn-dependent peptidases